MATRRREEHRRAAVRCGHKWVGAPGKQDARATGSSVGSGGSEGGSTFDRVPPAWRGPAGGESKKKHTFAPQGKSSVLMVDVL